MLLPPFRKKTNNPKQYLRETAECSGSYEEIFEIHLEFFPSFV